MTNHDQGSSLPQTHNSHIHRHSHRGYRHGHVHVRRQDNINNAGVDNISSFVPDSSRSLYVRSHEYLHHQHHHRPRQAADLDSNSIVTEVVQTVSVIQYVDGTGASLGVSTLYSPPTTHLVDGVTGITVDPSVAEPGLPTVIRSDSETLGVPTLVPGRGATSLSDSSTSPGFMSTESSLSLTSSPSANPFPTFLNAWNSSASSNSSLFNNKTRTPSFLNTTSFSSTSFSSSTSSETTLTLTTSSASSSSSFSVDAPTATVSNGSGVPGGPGVGGSTQPSGSTDTAAAATNSSLPPTSTLVGSVVGGVCGLALLVFAALLIVRWKRQKLNGHTRLADGDGEGTRALGGPAGGPPGSSGSGSRRFSTRISQRGMPFAIPSALAALSGQKRISAAPSEAETSERGFYRVSGRKLPSVFQHGGDGYSDPGAPSAVGGHNPRDSTMSGASFYRDSMAFFGGPGVLQRLAVGSPMRPESGIPVMQPGPARTPVTEQGPVMESTPRLTPPSLPRDQIGRSHSSQDNSRASASRFTEGI